MPAPRNSLDERAPAEPRRPAPPGRRGRSARRSRSPALRPAARRPESPRAERAERAGRGRRREEEGEEEEEEEEEREAWDWREARGARAWGAWEEREYYQGGARRGLRGGGKGRRAFDQSGGSSGSYAANARVYVGSLPGNITEGILLRKFQVYGEVLGLKVIPGRPGVGRTGAIIRFAEPAAAGAAVAALKDKVDIRHAKPNPRWDSY